MGKKKDKVYSNISNTKDTVYTQPNITIKTSQKEDTKTNVFSPRDNSKKPIPKTPNNTPNDTPNNTPNNTPITSPTNIVIESRISNSDKPTENTRISNSDKPTENTRISNSDKPTENTRISNSDKSTENTRISNSGENPKKKEKRERTLSEILEEDDKILFSLQALGGVQKNEKLTENGDLISVDDRWFLQGLRRWWNDDSRERSSNKILLVVKKAEKKILELLDMDYMTREQNEKKVSLEYKKQQEENDDRKKLIQKYCIALSKAKTGIENIRDTYEDKFTKNSCTLSIQKIDDIIEKIQKPYS